MNNALIILFIVGLILWLILKFTDANVRIKEILNVSFIVVLVVFVLGLLAKFGLLPFTSLK